ncbi:MAG: VWA domain-containing protein [Candidatus Aminicenantales bacterium]
MKRRVSSLAGVMAFLVILAAFLPSAGTPRPQSQDAQALTKPLQYEVAVVLKLVQVRVTDKKGNPVPDLIREDFAVTDNGTPVVLTAFERHTLGTPVAAASAAGQSEAAVEPRPADASAPRPADRKYFLFFDFAYNNVRGVLKARNAALHFLDTAVQPEDEVAVLTYAAIGGLAFHEYLTTDHDKVRKVIEAIGHSDIAGRATEIEDSYWRLMQDSPGSVIGAAMGLNFRAEAEANRQESKSMAQKYMAKMTALARALRLVEGQKHFILFSTGIPNSLIYGYTPGNAGYRSDTSGASGDHVLRRQNEAMYQEFSAAGCSFYAFDTRESAIEAPLFAYDEQTFATGSRSMSTTGDATNVFKDNKATGLNSLKRLTDITGGKYYSNINMYEKNLDQVQAATGSYYVLGYSINERWDGLFHDVKVEVMRKGCEVRTQAGYFNPKPFGEYSDLEKQIHLFDLAINERAFSRMPVDIPMVALASTVEGVSRLGVLAKLPGEVTAKLAGKRVEFVAIFFDEKGDIREIVRQEADPASFRGRETAFAAGSSLKPGDYSCRLIVRDMDTGLSAVASTKGTIGKPQAAGLQLGTPLLLEWRAGCSFVSARAKKGQEVFPWGDIYPYDPSMFVPIFAELPAAASGIQVVIPCSTPGGGAADLALRATLVDSVSGAQLPAAAAVSNRVQKGPLEVLTLELPTAGIAAGTYYLHFYAEDRASGSLGHTFTKLIVPRR